MSDSIMNLLPGYHGRRDRNKIQHLQDQISSLLTRKRRREDVSMEDENKHLKQCLKNSIKRRKNPKRTAIEEE